MADQRKTFQSNVARVKADARTNSAYLVQRLKRMTPAEFLRQPPHVFAQLTTKQYREIVATIAPNVKILRAPAGEPPTSETRTFMDWWRERSAFAQSFLAMLSVTVTFSGAGIFAPLATKWALSRVEIVRPISTATWPTCQRLSRYTDGCIYTPSQDLNWDWVAGQIDLPVEVLRRTNTHQPPQFIVRGAPLVIWRERGRLEK